MIHSNASHELALMLSTRPFRNLLVDALSYVEHNLLFNLKTKNNRGSSNLKFCFIYVMIVFTCSM